MRFSFLLAKSFLFVKDDRDAARTLEQFASHAAPIHHRDTGAAGAFDAAPAGRAGLTEKMAGIGWRSMHAQRNALLASLQGR